MLSWTGLRAPFRSSNSSGGFTLIEILVAFAILALTLTALLHVFSSGLRNIDAADRHLMATMLARSVLDEVGTEIPIIAGERSAEIEQGYRWTVRIFPSAALSPVSDSEWIQVPYEIHVEISWNGRPVVTLTTLRLMAEPDSSPGSGRDAPLAR